MTTAPQRRTVPLRCRLHLHRWVLRVNDSGERYHACRYCDTYNSRITANADSPGGLGFGA